MASGVKAAGASHFVYVDTFKRHNVKTSFTFLGYDFELRVVKSRKTGKLRRVCMPGASRKAMKEITRPIKSWRIHRGTADDPTKLAVRYNATLRGWIEYSGKHWYLNFGYRLWSVFQSRLIKWVKSKYRLSTRRAEHRLHVMQKENPKLFVLWYLLRAKNT